LGGVEGGEGLGEERSDELGGAGAKRITKRVGVIGEARSEATSGRLLVMFDVCAGRAMLLLSFRSSCRFAPTSLRSLLTPFVRPPPPPSQPSQRRAGVAVGK